MSDIIPLPRDRPPVTAGQAASQAAVDEAFTDHRTRKTPTRSAGRTPETGTAPQGQDATSPCESIANEGLILED